jgi:threonine dehydrogenase-like Zn-dependent dehydrogenase
MRSLLMEGSSRVRIIEEADPIPQPGEVVIQTAISAICGSEMHGYRGQGQARSEERREGVGVLREEERAGGVLAAATAITAQKGSTRGVPTSPAMAACMPSGSG